MGGVLAPHVFRGSEHSRTPCTTESSSVLLSNAMRWRREKEEGEKAPRHAAERVPRRSASLRGVASLGPKGATAEYARRELPQKRQQVRGREVPLAAGREAVHHGDDVHAAVGATVLLRHPGHAG
jgi:hypothetical protein